jgi:tetratricopeptide (TPR) repeat protein
MVEPELQDVPAWMERGLFHLQHLDYAEALHCFRQALMLDPSLPDGWLNYGSVLEKLGCYGAAIAANSNAQKLYGNPTLRLAPPESEPTDAIAAALALQTSSADYWLGRGHTLCDQGSYDQAIISYDKALSLRPEDSQAWFGRGNMAAALGDFETAIASYDRATECEPNDYQAWNNRGYVLHRLGQYEAAIASYDEAINCKADCYPAWNNRGYAQFHLEQYEAAIAEFDQALALNPSYPEAWHNRGNALRALGRLEDAIVSYDRALALKPEFQDARENRSLTQRALQPNATELPGTLHTTADLQLGTLSREYSSLSVLLEKSIDRCREGACSAAEPLVQQGIQKLESLLLNPKLEPAQFTALDRQYASFQQLQVDLWVERDPELALELAEASKNRHLNRMYGQRLKASKFSYPQMQACLSEHTAAIYWHLSPANLHTFILRQNHPPIVVSSRHQVQRFEAWIQQWQQHYEQFCTLNPESAPTAPWRQTMAYRLEQLSEILEINVLCQTYFQDIDQIVLIPHRGLHLLPLHTLFPDALQITYLSSVEWGLDFPQRAPGKIQRLLNIEAPNSVLNVSKELSTDLTAAALAQHYGKVKSFTLPHAEATSSRVAAALTLMSDCLHFSGICRQSILDPTQSVLALLGTETLTFTEISMLNLSRYAVVCLPTCEFMETGEGAISQDIVPIASSFLAAGVSYVMSSLWLVDELPRTLLTLQFHQGLRQAMHPAAALAKAQKWLRTATQSTLMQSGQAQSLTISMKDLGEDLYPYAHPFYWAGFMVTGQMPYPSVAPLDTSALQAFSEAIATHQESAQLRTKSLHQASLPLGLSSNLELQTDLDQVTSHIQQIIQKYPSIKQHYNIALQKLLQRKSI